MDFSVLYPFRDALESVWEPVSDWASGYTSANAAERFEEYNLALQQQYNEKNMELQQGYNEKNMGLTDSYQRQLMSDSASLQVEALRRAGINPLLAVNNGISSANTAVHSSAPTSTTPMPSGPSVNSKFGVGDVINGIGMLSGLAKLGPEIAFLQSQTAAQKASSALDVARTFKTMQEADSIDPRLEKEVKAQGKSWIGQLSHDLTSMITGRWDAGFSNSASSVQSDTLDSISTHSAKSVDDSVKRVEKSLDKVHVLPRMRHETSKPVKPVNKRRHN